MKQIVITRATEICKTRKIGIQQTNRTRWWNGRVKNEVKEKKILWKRYINSKSEVDKQNYIEQRNKVKKIIKEEKKKSWTKFGEFVTEEYTKNKKHFWNIVKNLKNKNEKVIRGIRDQNNTLETNVKDILRVWAEYYKIKFETKENDPPEETTEGGTTEENDEDIIMEELEEAIRNIKTGKAKGLDEIDPEMIKYLGHEGKKWLLNILRMIWSTGKLPNDWEQNMIIPIYKKGDFTNCQNYRAICISSICFKLYTQILEKRLREYVDGKIAQEQAAYMKGKQTNDNIQILRNITERSIEQKKELYLTFLDLTAAFDNVKRQHIWDSLYELEVPRSLVKAIKAAYKNVQGTVVIDGESSAPFKINKGIKQGDSLSPLLFIIVMDRILKSIRKTSTNLQTCIGQYQLTPIKVDSLLYADDIVLISDTQQKMKKLVEIWNNEIEKMGMTLNVEKCKLLIANKQTIDPVRIQIKGQNIEEVTAYEYLGSIFTNDGKIDLDIANRRQKGNRVYYALSKSILGKTEIDISTKLEVYNTVAVPTILYSCETWTIDKKHEDKIIATEMKYLRKIAGKTKWDRIRNEHIRTTLNQEPITKKIQKQQLRWYGHITRMSSNKLVKRVTEAGNIGKRGRGRPRKRWADRIAEIGAKHGKTVGELSMEETD